MNRGQLGSVRRLSQQPLPGHQQQTSQSGPSLHRSSSKTHRAGHLVEVLLALLAHSPGRCPVVDAPAHRNPDSAAMSRGTKNLSQETFLQAALSRTKTRIANQVSRCLLSVLVGACTWHKCPCQPATGQGAEAASPADLAPLLEGQPRRVRVLLAQQLPHLRLPRSTLVLRAHAEALDRCRTWHTAHGT